MGHISEGDDVLALDIAEHCDFLPVFLIEIRLGPTDDDIWLDTDFPQFGHRLLGGFGFHLAGGLDIGQEGDVDETDVFLSYFQCVLAQGLQK